MTSRYDAGYVRVSSRRQRDEGDSPANQEAQLRRAGATVVFRDLAVSGFRLEARRQAEDFRRLSAEVAAGRINRLLVTRLDRAARRDQIVLELAQLCSDHGTEFLALGSGVVDASTAAGWLSVKMQLVVAEHFSRQLSESIRSGRAAAISRGCSTRASSTLPFHLQRDPGTRDGVIPSPAWDDARHGIERLLAGEWRLTQFARFIHDRHGRLQQAASAGRWIRSRCLTGDVRTKAGTLLLPGAWPAIATADEQDRLVALAEASRSRWGAASKVPPRMLSGLCICGECAAPLMYQFIDRKYLYLRCSSATCVHRGRHVPAMAIENQFAALFLLPHMEKLVSAKVPACEEPSSVKEWRRELRLRERAPTEYLLPAEVERMAELRSLIKYAENGATSQGTNTHAAMALRMTNATLGPGSWMDAPASERNADLRTLVRRIVIAIPSKTVSVVEWLHS
jgi:DNA invertase Pin-like site-specific DNA recombinase